MRAETYFGYGDPPEKIRPRSLWHRLRSLVWCNKLLRVDCRKGVHNPVYFHRIKGDYDVFGNNKLQFCPHQRREFRVK
jgi:hypothetical protein